MALNNSIYFAAQDASKTSGYLREKVDEWCNSLTSSGFLEKLRSMFAAYHGAYYTDAGSGHQITFSGEQGELTNLPINHFRNIATHILNMTCSNRPAMECRATNTDYKSLQQTILAGNILEYYMREKKLEQYIKTAVEYAIVYGSGYVKMDWDATKGEMVDYIEETKTPIFEGDITFSNLSVFDVVYDGTKEHEVDCEWVLVRTWKNKFDLAAKYPELAEKIIGLQTKNDINKYKAGLTTLLDKTDDVEVIEFYHKRSDALPDGRYIMFLDEDIILQDAPMPYRVLPVFRISAGEIHGSPHGYTCMFDILPIQEAVNALYSTILTNQAAFGVQNILIPRGSDVALSGLSGGLNIIEYNQTAGAPSPLNLTKTPEEVFQFLQMLEHTMETLSGVNSVARGNPEASLKSGTALALVQSMALQFMSGLQQNYVNLIENLGTGMIKIFQDFANTPRLIAITGKSNRGYMKEFSGRDISNISRVVVDIGNPMAKTTAGRVQMAQELIQYGQISPSQYVNIIHTGNLDDLTDQIQHENLLMRAENESMMDGETPIVTSIDKHKDHIDYHSGLLADPDLRKDPDLVQRVLGHIQEHINSLRTVDPQLLMLLGQQPLSPPGPPHGPPPGAAPNGPPGPGGPPPGPPQMGPPGAQQQGHPQQKPKEPPHPKKQQMAAQMMPPEAGQLGPGIIGGKVIGPGAPPNGQSLPNLPKVNGNLLPNLALQQQSLDNIKMK